MASYIGSKNPFEDEEDDFEDVSPEVAHLKQEKELYEQRMVESSFRSIRLINDSQAVATETAEALDTQKEQLKRTQHNLNKIDAQLNHTDRHITSLKGIWGTVSTWFKNPIKDPVNAPPQTNEKTTNSLKTMKNENTTMKNDLQRMDVDLSWSGDGKTSSARTTTNGSSRSKADEIVDQNLDHMLAGLQQLKAQGLALGNELDEHNELIKDIHATSEKQNMRVEGQNAKIRKILK